jgi:hypothetical protein
MGAGRGAPWHVRLRLDWGSAAQRLSAAGGKAQGPQWTPLLSPLSTISQPGPSMRELRQK